ncbi:unnamed protein product [Ostreobium quekettii]|uniref:Uncharacterized protein n=1 Tax=Ostreobium quekettii TaxID=121088 RepID=A0A8S1J4L6_9CHLO|nr:unnamed protein product [Ostreobium quekettii]|eukprot:evm.model.scf_598EXC.5 EVM.evm.TU.scf_598EXC.5   scf_598EXC:58932-62928(-)
MGHASIQECASGKITLLWNELLRCYPDMRLSRRDSSLELRNRQKLIMQQIEGRWGAVRDLDLSFNEVSDKGAACLRDALSLDCCLQVLHLQGNNLSSVSFAEFGDLMREGGKLLEVDLRNCRGVDAVLIQNGYGPDLESVREFRGPEDIEVLKIQAEATSLENGQSQREENLDKYSQQPGDTTAIRFAAKNIFIAIDMLKKRRGRRRT